MTNTRSTNFETASTELIPYSDPNESFNAIYLPRAARFLRSKGLTEAEAIELLEEQREACHAIRDREVQEDEVERAVETVYATPQKGRPKGKQWTAPKFSRPLFDKLTRPDGEATLKARMRDSLVKCPKWYLSHLFHPNGLISTVIQRPVIDPNTGKKKLAFPRPITEPTETFETRYLRSCSHVCANTKNNKYGTTEKGKKTQHSKNQIDFRSYVVIESDCLAIEDQWKALEYLSRNLPLVMIVSSGGKSLHGWFDVLDVPEATVQRFFDIACTLGADPAIYKVSQWVRMPYGTRTWWNAEGEKERTACQEVLAISEDFERMDRSAAERFRAWERSFETANPVVEAIVDSDKLAGKPGAPRIVKTQAGFFVNYNGAWVKMDHLGLMIHLRQSIQDDFAENDQKAPKPSDVDAMITSILAPVVRNPCYAAPLPFHPKTVINLAGERYLNISKCPPPLTLPNRETVGLDEAEERAMPILSFFAQAFRDQADYVIDWIRQFYVPIIEGKPQKGLALVLVGPVGCGKGFLCETIIGGLIAGTWNDDGSISGRYRDATAWLVEGSTFVDNVLDSPVHLLHDVPGLSQRRKVAYTQHIKKIIADGAVEFHPKFGQAIEIPYFGRIILGLNDDEESLEALPDLDLNTDDKMSVLRIHSGAKLPPRNHVPTAEALPYFGRWLELTEYVTPRSQRFGLASFIDPVIRDLGREMNTETHGACILEEFAEKNPGWSGSASELLRELLNLGSDYSERQILGQFPSALHLGRQIKKLKRQGKLSSLKTSRTSQKRLISVVNR